MPTYRDHRKIFARRQDKNLRLSFDSYKALPIEELLQELKVKRISIYSDYKEYLAELLHRDDDGLNASKQNHRSKTMDELWETLTKQIFAIDKVPWERKAIINRLAPEEASKVVIDLRHEKTKRRTRLKGSNRDKLEPIRSSDEKKAARARGIAQQRTKSSKEYVPKPTRPKWAQSKRMGNAGPPPSEAPTATQTSPKTSQKLGLKTITPPRPRQLNQKSRVRMSVSRPNNPLPPLPQSLQRNTIYRLP
ncbi:hypothetical protein K469DRAFT_326360 [Zopfia rhizophila CBS 207.26]|uniref:Uncharacterized protein n=1 Tax=Zopfia rhizophila CBS 207.26 TaxID=1314779 RepID=A0A6A6DHE3_9PEZI|nr:hypothetical protein K469DRAFT_326360 [Zopfia rhizophila CBS 207.26]